MVGSVLMCCRECGDRLEIQGYHRDSHGVWYRAVRCVGCKVVLYVRSGL